MRKPGIPSRSNRRNLFRIIIGLLALFIGTLVYLIDRPPGDTYFVSRCRIWISLHETLPALFGSVGRNLPDFIHPFAFILITAGFCNAGEKVSIAITAGWFILECGFELGQKYSAAIVPLVPDWFTGIPFLENTKNFFKNGTFDIWDLVAICAGSICAYGVLRLTRTPLKTSP